MLTILNNKCYIHLVISTLDEQTDHCSPFHKRIDATKLYWAILKSEKYLWKEIVELQWNM